MMGFDRSTCSPWSSSINRSTPWVLGCWGPMLMIIVWSSPATSCSPMAAASVSDRRKTQWRSRISRVRLAVSVTVASPRSGGALELDRDAPHRVVLAQGVAVPVLRHEDAGHVGVVVEDDAVHVEHLPLGCLRPGE